LETQLIRSAVAAALAVTVSAATAAAQQPVTPGLPPPQVVPPTQSAPPAQEPPPPATTPGPPAPGTATPPLTRTFATKNGMLFNTVRPDRVADFEAVIWYLQQALQKSTNPTVRAQAEGWHVLRAVEPGPNNTVLYVFVLDPAVPRADYGLGRILADAYPEQIAEIWRMYQGSVTGGGSLLNLMPVEPVEPLPIAPATGAGAKPATPAAPRTPPPAATAKP
jgi:hypothetical protein